VWLLKTEYPIPGFLSPTPTPTILVNPWAPVLHHRERSGTADTTRSAHGPMVLKGLIKLFVDADCRVCAPIADGSVPTMRCLFVGCPWTPCHLMACTFTALSLAYIQITVYSTLQYCTYSSPHCGTDPVRLASTTTVPWAWPLALAVTGAYSTYTSSVLALYTLYRTPAVSKLSVSVTDTQIYCCTTNMLYA
jgi:hypothetical protein